MSNKIKRINKKLVEHFGIPPKAENPPKPIDLLIATILSQNTNDNNSYKAFQNLKNKFPDWEEIASASLPVIEKAIRSAGLNKQKAKAIKNAVSGLLSSKGKVELKFKAEQSDDEIIEYLTSFEGVGVKTASCVLLFALERNVCPVDTHVHRTVNRLGIVNGKTPAKTFALLNKNFPVGIAHQFHTNLIRLGRRICKPKEPLCNLCPLSEDCVFENKNLRSERKIGKERNFMLLDNVGNK